MQLKQNVPVIKRVNKPTTIVTLVIDNLYRKLDGVVYAGFFDHKIEWKPENSVDWADVYNQSVLRIEGKTTSRYVKKYHFNIPHSGPYDVRVTKVGPAENDESNVCDVVWENFDA